MNSGLINKDKRSPNYQLVFVKNSEASKTIHKGAPCYWELDGTDDGLDVKCPSSGGDLLAHGFFAGVPVKDALAFGDSGAIVAYGFVPALKITRATRAASTDSWSSSQSVSAGQQMLIDTVNDAFVDASVTFGDTSTVASDLEAFSLPDKAFLARVRLGESIPSMAASASATSDTRTVITTNSKGFVFAM